MSDVMMSPYQLMTAIEDPEYTIMVGQATQVPMLIVRTRGDVIKSPYNEVWI